MEACASSHYWGRELRALGHEAKLIPPQYVKPYLRGNKNDYNDARAIAEASTRPSMPFVAIKTVAEQDMQAIHRMRSQCIRDRTALSNSTRGLLGEYGIILSRGLATLRKSIHGLLEDADNGLSDRFRNLLARRYEQLVELDKHVDFYTNELEVLSQQDDSCQRFQTIPGFALSYPVPSVAPSVMVTLMTTVVTPLRRWDWFHVSIAVAVRMFCSALASEAIATCAAYSFMVPGLLLSRPPERMIP